jgi:pyruvate-ferredoxin/flavodoxin oxidoreductase
LNAQWESHEEIEANMPGYAKQMIKQHRVQCYTINTGVLANKLGLRGYINMIMSVCFFAFATVIPVEPATEMLKASVVKLYTKKGPAIVKQNTAAIDQSLEALKPFEYDAAAWAAAPLDAPRVTGDPFVDGIVTPIAHQEASPLPVSALPSVAIGTFPAGTSHYGSTASRPPSRAGTRRTVCSATRAPLSARMRLRARSSSTQCRTRRHRRSLRSR